MIKVAGIVRKSPTNRGVEESVQIQKDVILRWAIAKFGIDGFIVEWFVDKNISGDDPNRPALKNLFSRVGEFDYAVARHVERYFRHYLGLVWFYKYFSTNDGQDVHNGCKLCFVEGCPELYTVDNLVDGTNAAIFGMFCLMAYADLLKNRSRADAGREKLKKDPKAWKEKYQGRKKGAKNKK